MRREKKERKRMQEDKSLFEDINNRKSKSSKKRGNNKNIIQNEAITTKGNQRTMAVWHAHEQFYSKKKIK